MAIDQSKEKLITFERAAKRLGVKYAQVWSYSRKGRLGVFLDTVPLGVRDVRTSIEACDRFAAAILAKRLAREDDLREGVPVRANREKPARSAGAR